MTACSCPEKSAPLPVDLKPGDNRRPRQWFVIRRNRSRSAFNGYCEQWSDFSDVYCRACGRYWRTKAAYVSGLLNCEFWPNHAPRVERIEDQ